MPYNTPVNLSPPQIPFPFGLRYVAQFLPYGLRGMMDLAWMSQDLRAKKVGSFWLFSDKATQEGADLEALCEKAHITPAELIGAVVKVAYELRVDVSSLIGGIDHMPQALETAFTNAIRTGERLAEAVTVIGRIGREVLRR